MEAKAMDLKIKKILLSSEIDSLSDENQQDAHTDVVVQMSNGEKYVASFFTYKNLQTLQSENQKIGHFLGGKYFWMKGMLMVENCTREIIELVIKDLMEEGDFKRIFQKIN